MFVARLFQVVGDQSAAKPSAAIQHERRALVGDTCLDVALDDDFAQVSRAQGVARFMICPSWVRAVRAETTFVMDDLACRIAGSFTELIN